MKSAVPLPRKEILLYDLGHPTWVGCLVRFELGLFTNAMEIESRGKGA